MNQDISSANKAKQWRLHYKLNGPTIHRSEKVCQRCKQLKAIDEFPINRDKPDWRGSRCKPCNTAIKDEWRKKNPEKARAASLRQAAKTKNKPDDARLKYSRKYYKTHKEVQARRTAEWKNKNRPKYNAYMASYHKAKMQSNPSYAFAVKIRSKIRLLLSGYQKTSPTEQLLGCKIADLKKYLESLWEPWMSWGNYGGKDGQWCIDHIMPVAAFDLSQPEEQKRCFHYSNLRPLCVKKNREKSHKYDPEELSKLRGLHSINQP